MARKLRSPSRRLQPSFSGLVPLRSYETRPALDGSLTHTVMLFGDRVMGTICALTKVEALSAEEPDYPAAAERPSCSYCHGRDPRWVSDLGECV